MVERASTKSRFDTYFEQVMNEVDESHRNGTEISNETHRKALELQALALQLFARTSYEGSKQKNDEANLSNEKHSKTFGKKSIVIMSVISAAASVAGGGAGIFAGVGGGCGFLSSATNKAISQVSKGLGAVGMGTQTAASIPQGMSERQRTMYQYLTNVYAESMREQQRIAQESNQRVSRIYDVISAGADKRFQTGQHILSSR